MWSQTRRRHNIPAEPQPLCEITHPSGPDRPATALKPFLRSPVAPTLSALGAISTTSCGRMADDASYEHVDHTLARTYLETPPPSADGEDSTDDGNSSISSADDNSSSLSGDDDGDVHQAPVKRVLFADDADSPSADADADPSRESRVETPPPQPVPPTVRCHAPTTLDEFFRRITESTSAYAMSYEDAMFLKTLTTAACNGKGFDVAFKLTDIKPIWYQAVVVISALSGVEQRFQYEGVRLTAAKVVRPDESLSQRNPRELLRYLWPYPQPVPAIIASMQKRKLCLTSVLQERIITRTNDDTVLLTAAVEHGYQALFACNLLTITTLK